jgi:hypothetical protein
MAIMEALGDDFYLFRKNVHAKQLMLEGHGSYTPFDRAKNLKHLGATALVWLGPHGMTNSGGAFMDDLVGNATFNTPIARYHSVTTGRPEFDYIIGKFDTKAAASYTAVEGFIDNRTLAIDIVTVRNRFGLSRTRLSDLFAALAGANLQYNYIICNICREVTTVAFDKANEWGPEDNPMGNKLALLPNWDNSNV